MIVRVYHPSDRAGCLAVFDSNVGTSFLPAERPEFSAFLDALPGPYLVLEENGEIVACGGYAPNPEAPGIADLCWGMVRHDAQGSGVGKRLTTCRLERIHDDPSFTHVFLKTSKDTAAFYERFGFVTEQVVENGIAEGVHRYDMKLAITR